LLNENLTMWGCEVIAVSDGEKALFELQDARLANNPFDLILLDKMMPVMDGEELGQRIKNDVTTKHIPTVMLTSFGARGDGEKMADIGFDGYINKPIKRNELFALLNTVISRYRENKKTYSAELITRHSIEDDKKQNTKILIAEDDIVNQLVINGFLQKLGYSALIVDNGQKAVDACNSDHYDFVFMDCQMPVLSGFDAAKQIRNDERQHDKPPSIIIAVTGNAGDEDKAEAISTGMDNYLIKPIDKELLANIFKQHIK